MKYYVKLTLTLMCCVFLLAGVSMAGEDKADTTKNSNDAAKTEASDKKADKPDDKDKQEYIKAAKNKLDEWGAKISQWSDQAAEKAKSAKGSAAKDLDAAGKKLEEGYEAAKAKFGELSEATGDTWEDMKSGLDKAFQNMEDAYNEATADK
jgi:hypothetical protein